MKINHDDPSRTWLFQDWGHDKCRIIVGMPYQYWLSLNRIYSEKRGWFASREDKAGT